MDKTVLFIRRAAILGSLALLILFVIGSLRSVNSSQSQVVHAAPALTQEPTSTKVECSNGEPWVTNGLCLPMIVKSQLPTSTPTPAASVPVYWPQPFGTAADFGGCASWGKSPFVWVGAERFYHVQVGRPGGPYQTVHNSTEMSVEYWPPERDGKFVFMITEVIEGAGTAFSMVTFEFLPDSERWDCNATPPVTPAPP